MTFIYDGTPHRYLGAKEIINWTNRRNRDRDRLIQRLLHLNIAFSYKSCLSVRSQRSDLVHYICHAYLELTTFLTVDVSSGNYTDYRLLEPIKNEGANHHYRYHVQALPNNAPSTILLYQGSIGE